MVIGGEKARDLGDARSRRSGCGSMVAQRRACATAAKTFALAQAALLHESTGISACHVSCSPSTCSTFILRAPQSKTGVVCPAFPPRGRCLHCVVSLTSFYRANWTLLEVRAQTTIKAKRWNERELRTTPIIKATLCDCAWGALNCFGSDSGFGSATLLQLPPSAVLHMWLRPRSTLQQRRKILDRYS
ncbi:hypothetical protein EJ03DRAFT_6674 [Teratosphaeria nubilosa]|uniref:Uncharacterized protein n=1 Tax=Teratosphaeria nubilosa TaxID=161662 RepID=A0A6G1LPS1_9PEZI|nr:hypothetical protein EJ03DRAFT_6674 [Teratosphaeria nubilosa]